MTLLDEPDRDLLPPQLDDDEASFAVEALRFLGAHAPRRPPEVQAWGHGVEPLTIFHETSGEEEWAEVDAATTWQATKWEAGFGWLTGPAALGGRALSPQFERLFRTLEAGFDVPDWQPIRIGLSTVSPAIVACGTTGQAAHFSVGIQSGALVACQLFSEPEAGSDLAGVRTRAERDGELWRLRGQKVWTSNAQVADIGLALCRTDPSTSRHAGLTAFVVPMHQPGVDVRPIRQLTGGASFTEVFLDDALVPDDHRIGDVGEGWNVAVATLAGERTSTADRSHGLTARALAVLLTLAARTGANRDAVHRQRLADLTIRLRVAAFHQVRMQALPPDRLRGPERAMDKLALAQNLRLLGEAAAAILGPRLAADTGEWGTYAWGRWILGATGYRLGGGTDEIIKTMVGERLLGLPREPK